MNDCSCTDGDIPPQLYILTDDCSRVNCELVTARSKHVSKHAGEAEEKENTLVPFSMSRYMRVCRKTPAMDNSAAASTVAQGTLITSTLSASATGLYAIAYRNPNYALLAGASALNSGITAATFFSLREYAISPTLMRVQRGRELGSLSWTDRRTRHLLDSGLSGAATGGILRGWKSGPAAVLPGATIAATICVLLQYAFNEAGIARLRYASRYHASPPAHPELDHDPSPTLAQRMLNIIGVRKMADDEYLEQMKKTRDHHLRRIAQLEAEHKDNGHNGQKE